MVILFSNRVSKEFIDKVIYISGQLGINPNWLMFVMGFETGWTYSPQSRNKDTRATGLIQFLPSTAIDLGTTVDALYNMTAIQQLDYVYEYLRRVQKNFGKFSSYHDLYLGLFYPKSIDETDKYIIGLERGSAYVYSVAQQNSGFDLNKDIKVTKGEVKQWLDIKARQVVPQSLVNDFFKKKNFFELYKREIFFWGGIAVGSIIVIWLYRRFLK